MEKRDFIKTGIVGTAAIIASPSFAKTSKSISDQFYRVAPNIQEIKDSTSFVDNKALQKHHFHFFEKVSLSLREQFDNKTSAKDILINRDNYDNNIVEQAAIYYNHRLYFKSLMPKKHHGDINYFTHLVKKQYGSYSNFKNEFIESANQLSGNGWVWLSYKNNQLKISAQSGNTSPLMLNSSDNNSGFPLLGMDLWEHAYTATFDTNRFDYAKNFINSFNKSFVSKQIQKAIEFYA